MRFIIVTGMSGSGKITALKMLEDAGFYCADNLPLPLVDKFASLAAGAEEYQKVALGLDVRSIKRQEDITGLLQRLDAAGQEIEILFLEASDETLIRRYKESRRAHPLAGADGHVAGGIARERVIMRPMKERATYIIDTSHLLTRDLRRELEKVVVRREAFSNLVVSVLSFGFKYGIPADADLVFDVRFLPNPYYVDELKQLTGEEKAVQDYVMSGGVGQDFEKRWFDLIDFLLPQYAAEGKTGLVIAVGCTGGRHRSVTMAIRLAAHLEKESGYGVQLDHRDVRR